MDNVDDEVPTDDPEIKVTIDPIVELVENGHIMHDDLGALAEFVILAYSYPNTSNNFLEYRVMPYVYYKEEYQLDKDGIELVDYKAPSLSDEEDDMYE